MRHRELLLLFALIAPAPCRAAFESHHGSARALALGGAAVASPEDPGDALLNPAAAPSAEPSGLSMTYGKPFAGMEGVNFQAGEMALVSRLSRGALAFSFAGFQAQNLLQEQTLSLSYGRTFLEKIHVGANLKRLFHSFDSGSDP